MDPKDTHPPLADQPPAPPPITAETNRLVRIETRLVILMRHLGLDANGKKLDQAANEEKPR